MKTKYFLWMVLGILCWWGCGDDSESLEPSGIDEWHPVLVDGGHDYDAKIKDWNERTGVYILYKFTPRDIYYNGDGNWREVFQDTTWERETYTIGENVYVDGDYVVVDGDRYPLGITADGDYAWQQVSLSEDETIVEIMNYEVKVNMGVIVEEADETYVGQQLAWVEDMFLNFYPDEVLRESCPLTIILGKNLKESPGTRPDRIVEVPYHYSFHNLIFSYGDNSIEALTQEEKDEIRLDLNYWFITTMLSSSISFEDFYAVTDYYWEGGSVSSRPTDDMTYDLGLIQSSQSNNLTTIKETDLESYLKMILTTSYETLTMEPESGEYSGDDYTGILHPKKDREGLIREKYNLLIGEFERLGIDLQAMGNY